MTIDRFENPIVDMTDKDLCWIAWQTARLIEPAQQVGEPDANFCEWWERQPFGAPGIGTLRLLALQAFGDSNPHATANERDARFMLWWQTIVDAQLVT